MSSPHITRSIVNKTAPPVSREYWIRRIQELRTCDSATSLFWNCTIGKTENNYAVQYAVPSDTTGIIRAQPSSGNAQRHKELHNRGTLQTLLQTGTRCQHKFLFVPFLRPWFLSVWRRLPSVLLVFHHTSFVQPLHQVFTLGQAAAVKASGWFESVVGCTSLLEDENSLSTSCVQRDFRSRMKEHLREVLLLCQLSTKWNKMLMAAGHELECFDVRACWTTGTDYLKSWSSMFFKKGCAKSLIAHSVLRPGEAFEMIAILHRGIRYRSSLFHQSSGPSPGTSCQRWFCWQFWDRGEFLEIHLTMLINQYGGFSK